MKFIDYISWTIPWFAPMTTAYIIWEASVNILRLPKLIAVSAALTLEGLGLSTVAMTLILWNYNHSKRKTDPAAPTWLSGSLIAVYFICAIVLTVILKITPINAVYALAMFPALSILGMICIALGADHARRLNAIAKDKAERKEKRIARLAVASHASPKYICDNCGFVAKNRYALSAHRKKHKQNAF